jgi:hypothetical protein
MAFMSYAHFDDQNGLISKLRERLSYHVQAWTGREFPIFQDRNHISWGQKWKERIIESVDAATFLIAVLTPSYLISDYCRDELHCFLGREKQLERNDLVLPIYYITCDLFEELERSEDDQLVHALELRSRQYIDWRKLRNLSKSDRRVKDMLDALAIQVKLALRRVNSAITI